MYQKVSSFKNAFLEPVLHDVSIGMQEENIRGDIDEIDYQCSQFQVFKEQTISNGLLVPSRVMRNLFLFTTAIGHSLEARFPEMDFVVNNLSFLCPENRKHCRCDVEAVVTRYCQGAVDATVAKMQYSVYRNDDSLDFLYLNCDKKPDSFFCNIAKMSEYDQFGLLGVILLCMSPDTVECERGFSTVNLQIFYTSQPREFACSSVYFLGWKNTGYISMALYKIRCLNLCLSIDPRIYKPWFMQ